jgi:leucyl aminopeptidase
MDVLCNTSEPASAGADLIAVAAGPNARALGVSQRACEDADPLAMVYGDPTIAVVATGPGLDGLRTAAARVVRASRPGEAIAWGLDPGSPLATGDQVRALAEGAVLGAYDPRAPRDGGRFIVCGPDATGQTSIAEHAALTARWCNVARELVDAPSNVMTPAELARRAEAIPGLEAEVLDATAADLPALAAVGGSSPVAPRLIVLRHRPADAPNAPRLGLIGKGVTFDTGGYFLKAKPEIVRQKADMAGGAAVLAAAGAIAELGIPLSVTAIVPACENLLSGTALRPTDVIRTAAGVTVEVANPDAEGRLILADALWYARRDGATHLVDLATLTGGVPDALGDVHAGVFGNDPEWRDSVADAGTAAGDPAWPLPLHRRYEAWLRSDVADLRNVAGRPLGFSIFAATFLAQFAGDGPWAHVDMLGTALAGEDRGDGIGPGATGYGVRMLVELAGRLGARSVA